MAKKPEIEKPRPRMIAVPMTDTMDWALSHAAKADNRSKGSMVAEFIRRGLLRSQGKEGKA